MKVNITIFLVCFGVLFFPSLLFAQSNQMIDELISEEKASFGKTVYLILAAADMVPEDAGADEAVKALEETGWNVKIKEREEPIQLGLFSYITMKAFDIKGGLFYTLFPSPRYASRELGFKGYIKDDEGAYRYMSGYEAIKILGRVVRDQEVSS